MFLTEGVPFAEEGHKASPRQSPKRSPRGVVQTPSQKPPTSSRSQAEPSCPVSKAPPHQALSSSLPSELQSSPPDANQPSGNSASSAQPGAGSHQLPTSVLCKSLSHPHSAAAEQSSAGPRGESSSLHIPAGSGSQHQHRAGPSQSAESHHKGHLALSVKTTSQSPAGPPNQEMLAGLGSALRAQARLRRKAVAPETSSPDDRESDVTGRLGEVSPSGQLSFDDIELKSKGAARPKT